MRRRRLAIVAAALLGGCTNMVMSERPLFTQADAKGAPVFRPGVWASPEPGCGVDLKGPLSGWPKCAHGDVMGSNGLSDPNIPLKSMVAVGDPFIVQIVIPAELAKAAKDLPGGGASVLYAAIKPTRTDDKGQVIAFEGWPVECGPPSAPPRKAEDGSDIRFVTKAPLPGVTMVEDHCLAAKAATVRAAASASRGWQTEVHETRWIRDGKD